MENEGERQCYICLESVPAEQWATEQSRWVSPCVCAGSMAWVHQWCVMRWVLNQERRGIRPVCGTCGTAFTFTTEKGQLMEILDLLYKKVVPVCRRIVTHTVISMAVDTSIITLGYFALSLIYDNYEATTITEFVCVRLISYSLTFTNYLPWEEFVLDKFRKLSKYRVLGKILPADAPGLYKAPIKPKTLFDVIGGAVLTPVFAGIVGNVLFSSVESTLGKFVLGGVTFLVVKGVLSMYVNQKLMKRRQRMDVLPVEEIN